MDTRALPSYLTNRDLFPAAALAAGPPLGAGDPPDRYTLQQAASALDEIPRPLDADARPHGA